MKFIFPIGLNIWNSKLKMIWTICWERQTTKCNNAWNKKRLINELMKCIWFTKENRKNDNSEYDSLRLPIKKITSTITKYIDSGILQHAFSKRALIVNSNTKNSFFFFLSSWNVLFLLKSYMKIESLLKPFDESPSIECNLAGWYILHIWVLKSIFIISM